MKLPLVVAVAVGLAQRPAAALVVPPAPPQQMYCNVSGMTRAVRELIGSEVVHDRATSRVTPSTSALTEGPPRECPTFPICDARTAAQEAIWQAEAEVRRVEVLQRLRAYVLACEASGY